MRRRQPLILDPAFLLYFCRLKFQRLTGYTVREALGKNAGFQKSGENSDEFYAGMWAAIKAGREWTGRFINKRKDGTRGIDETRISPVRDANGTISHFLALRHDITKEAAMGEQLIQSQKMEALGLLAGQLSHDFNNLLTIIIGSMELIMEELPKESAGINWHRGYSRLPRSRQT